jgi:4-hydroxy-tetrahydrodipicolinate synthase
MSVGREERKAWAREALIGVENVTMPSFTLDFSDLDEAGIRWDVERAVEHGFFSTMCALETGLTTEEAKRFLEIVTDQAAGRILVSFTLLNDSFEQSVELLQHAEQVGCSHALLGYPQTFRPGSPDDIYAATAELAEASNLGLVLYASDKFDFARFHPSHIPFEAYDRIAELPTVVAMKVGFADPAVTFESLRRYGDRLLVNVGTPWLMGLFPLLHREYGVQWFGGGAWEFWQSPEKPNVVEYHRLVTSGRYEDAMKLYFSLAPATGVAMREGIGRGGDMGMYHWPMGKYVSWSVGGNGGLMREPAMRLSPQQMEMRKNALRAIGIEPRQPDDEFFVGRVNYKRESAGVG